MASFVIGAPLHAPVAEADGTYFSCVAGRNTSGTLVCSWQCVAGTIWAWATTNDGAAAVINAKTQCGGSGLASCSQGGTCIDSDTATGHGHAACEGSSINAGGFSINCYQSGGSSSSWPLLACGSIECTIGVAATLAERVPAVPPSGFRAAGVAILAFPDGAVGYACSEDLDVCVPVVTTCTTALDGLRTCAA